MGETFKTETRKNAGKKLGSELTHNLFVGDHERLKRTRQIQRKWSGEARLPTRDLGGG